MRFDGAQQQEGVPAAIQANPEQAREGRKGDEPRLSKNRLTMFKYCPRKEQKDLGANQHQLKSTKNQPLEFEAKSHERQEIYSHLIGLLWLKEPSKLHSHVMLMTLLHEFSPVLSCLYD